MIKPRKPKKAEIDQTPNATDEEKVAAKAKVDEAVTTAKNAIDQATNNAGVDTAKSNGLDSLTISNQRLLRKTKKTAIDKAAEAKKRKSTKHQTRQTKKSSSKSESR